MRPSLVDSHGGAANRQTAIPGSIPEVAAISVPAEGGGPRSALGELPLWHAERVREGILPSMPAGGTMPVGRR